MKRTIIFLVAIFIFNAAQAQNWAWVQAAQVDSPANYYSGIVAAASNALIWCIQKKAVYNNGIDEMGSYVIKEYDTSGAVADSINIGGIMKLITAKCDTAGNYYVLGYYYDSVIFSSGLMMARDVSGTAPQYFIFRLAKGTLHTDWFKLIGTSDTVTASYFTINNRALYLIQCPFAPIKYVYRYDLTTGDSTMVLQQSATTTEDIELHTIAVDDNENIYMTGGGLGPSTIIFNGDTVSSPAGVPYFSYLLRYKNNETLDWVHFQTDITVNQRTVSCYNNNTIYYSGIVDDSLTVGGVFVHKPAWVYDYLLAQMDSTGAANWLWQMQDTLGGDGQVENVYHTAVQNDGGICIYNNIRGYINWGGGVTTNSGLSSGNASIASYALTGSVNWVVSSEGIMARNGNIAYDGNNLWVTGTCEDSSRYSFGSYSLPTPGYNDASFCAKVNPTMPATTQTKTVIQTQSNMMVYPNPAHDVLYINTGKTTGVYTVQLYNVLGTVVYSSVYQASTVAAITTTTMPRGVYMVEMSDGQSRFVKKIVLE